jgi:hypothetical protein
MLHDKANGIATLSATKAFVDFLGRGNGKGGSLFVVERAVANVVGSPSFQFHKRPDDIMNIDPVLNFLYRLLGDQMGCGLWVVGESNIGFWLGYLTI